MIIITVNSKSRSIKDPCSIAELLTLLNIDLNGIAIAVNHNVISKSEWNKIKLKEKDNITIIKATQGG